MRQYMIDNIVGSIKKLTEAGMALIALAIVLEVIFGANVAFVGVGVVENVLVISFSLHLFFESRLEFLVGILLTDLMQEINDFL